MSQATPYTYYACACSGTPAFVATQSRKQPDATDEETEQQTFDPTSARANYALYPLDKLLYCADCHELRCPRCITEEIACWYCPQCLFEAPSSNVRSEGNRCPRSCYNCPLCTATLTVNSIDVPSTEERETSGPYILACSWCNWSSLQIDLTFDKSTNITGQLQRWRAAKYGNETSKDRQISQAERILVRSEGDSTPVSPSVYSEELGHLDDDGKKRTRKIGPDAEDVFVSLNAFYKQQIADTSDGYSGLGASDFSFVSPSSINRLLNLYNASGKRAKKPRPKEMREALTQDEGFRLFDAADEETALARLHAEGMDCVATTEQQHFQDKRYDARFVDDLLPVAALFRQKRIKRCRVCRQLLSRPEAKVTNTRYKFKLLALNHIPKLSLRALQLPNSLSASTAAGGGSLPVNPTATLTPLTTYTFLLTLTNPIFEPLRVTLATPATTPGPIQSRVTILCPQFEVGSNTDVWDEALTGPSVSATDPPRDTRRRAPPSSSSLSTFTTAGALSSEDQRVPEAGKLWARGRNWSSVVVEVVPGLIPGSRGYTAPAMGAAQQSHAPGKHDDDDNSDGDDNFDEEDECALEIPVFVRIEYEVDAGGEDEGVAAGMRATSVAASLAGGGGAGRETKEKEKRELAFWCVLGAGMIVK